MTRQNRSAAALVMLPLAVLVALVGPVAWAGQPHVPTEKELDRELSGIRADDGRGYQQLSVEEKESWYRGAANWVRELLSSIHITPARLALILGAAGSLYTWGKNKRHARWMVLAAISWLLLIVGAAAMYFHWPHWN